MALDNAIEDQAFDWLVKAEQGSLPPDEQARFQAWIEKDPRHFGAYKRAAAIYNYASLSYKAASGRQLAAHQPHAQNDDDLVQRRSFLKAAAVGFTAVAIGGTIFFARAGKAEAQVFTTGKGEIKLITLQDGSTIVLNTLTVVETVFSSDQRLVRLRKGEVSVNVVKAEEVNFSAAVDRCLLTTPRCQFTLSDLDESDPVVIIQDGMAEVSMDGSRPIRVGSDTRLSIDSRGRPEIRKLGAEEIEQKLLWQKGLVSFSDTSLAEAAKTYDRYSDTQIIIGDPRIAELRVTGVYSVGNPVGFARNIEELFGLNATYQGNKIILR